MSTREPISYTYDLTFSTLDPIDEKALKMALLNLGVIDQPWVLETTEDEHECDLCGDCGDCHQCLDNMREIEL